MPRIPKKASLDGKPYQLVGKIQQGVLTALQPKAAEQIPSQTKSVPEEPRMNEYDVSVGLELILSDVNDIKPPQSSSLHDQAKSIEDCKKEICRIYEELRNVADFLARRWNSNVESMSASRDTHHQFAPMESQFKEDMRIDHKWSYDEWVIGFSRSLSDDFLPSPVRVPITDSSLREPRHTACRDRRAHEISPPHGKCDCPQKLWSACTSLSISGIVDRQRVEDVETEFPLFEKPLRQILPEHRRARRLSGYPLAINYGLCEQPHPSDNRDMDWCGYLLSPKEIVVQKDNANPLALFFTTESLQQDDQPDLAPGPLFDYVVELRGPEGIDNADECIPAVDLAVRFTHASLTQGSARQLQDYEPTVMGLYNFLTEAKLEGMAVHLHSYFGPLIDSSGLYKLDAACASRVLAMPNFSLPILLLYL